MRPVRIIATVVFVAALAVTGCASRTADQTAAPVSSGPEALATTKATTSGEVTASFAVPSGFAGSHYPGRKDTFQANGRQSGTDASATFTVTG